MITSVHTILIVVLLAIGLAATYGPHGRGKG